VSGLGLELPCERQVHHEAGPAPLCTADADSTTVRHHNFLGDGQPETRSVLMPTGACLVSPIKAVEDMWKGAGRNTSACVRDRDLDLTPVFHGSDGHAATARRELQRVVHEVTEHLCQPVAVAHHRGQAFRN